MAGFKAGRSHAGIARPGDDLGNALSVDVSATFNRQLHERRCCLVPLPGQVAPATPWAARPMPTSPMRSAHMSSGSHDGPRERLISVGAVLSIANCPARKTTWHISTLLHMLSSALLCYDRARMPHMPSLEKPFENARRSWYAALFRIPSDPRWRHISVEMYPSQHRF